MNPRVLAGISIVLGLLCLGLSFAWPTLAGRSSSWDETRAIAHTQSGTEFHRRSFAGNGRPTAEQEAALAESQREWELGQAELQNLQQRPARIAGRLRIAGLCLTLVGAGLGWANKQ